MSDVSRTDNESDCAYIYFDRQFYGEQYNDLKLEKDQLYDHYLNVGWRENRWPHPYFDTAYYASKILHKTGGQTCPLLYFLSVGFKNGDVPFRFFSRKWYLAHNADVREQGADPLHHFIKHGDEEGRQPGPGFDSQKFISYSADLGKTVGSPVAHFFHKDRFGLQGIVCTDFKGLVTLSGQFDAKWYLETYRDVAAAKLDPLDHFVRHGAPEGRDPNADFDTAEYGENHPAFSLLYDSPFEFYLREDCDFKERLNKSNPYHRWLDKYDLLNKDFAIDISQAKSNAGVPKIDLLLIGDEISLKNIKAMFISCSSQSLSFNKVVLYTSKSDESDRSKIMELAREASIEIQIVQSCSELVDILATSRFLMLGIGASLSHRHECYVNTVYALKTPDFDICYADNDVFQEGTGRACPNFKPIFSPEYLKSVNYIGGRILLAWHKFSFEVQTSICSIICGDHASAIQNVFSLLPLGKVKSIPFITYHELESKKRDVRVRNISVIDSPTVTVIIPMKDNTNYTKQCIESIISYTQYDPLKIKVVIVDNHSTSESAARFFESIRENPRYSVLNYPHPFNFAALNNFAAKKQDSDVLVFLNNDTKLIDPLWLNKMVSLLQDATIGIVGAKLLFEDGSIQHAGCVIGASLGLVEHLGAAQLSDDSQPFWINATREVSAVTGACLAIRRSLFEEVGGFDEVLAVAWNDINLCLAVLERGYRNIVIGEALFYHYESRSRGFDDNEEKVRVFYREAGFVRNNFPSYFLDDPYYSPNLSLEGVGRLAVPPRVRSQDLELVEKDHRRVLMLSIVHNRGYGVPVVIEQQSAEMVHSGWEVVVGGPRGDRELSYEGSTRVTLRSPRDAACYAFINSISIVVAHTPPFFEITQFLGKHIPVVIYDYGEPSPDFFQEDVAKYLVNVIRKKRFSIPVARASAAISRSVKSEGTHLTTEVLGLGNSHLARWSGDLVPRRQSVRFGTGWTDKIVVLNVCRFAHTERFYKGLDRYADVKNLFATCFPALNSSLRWVLAGAAAPSDVAEMASLGFEVFPNVADSKLIDLYCGADFYMSFSKWEGYNLGIGQALALGLDVAASDIAAHREFPIFTSNSPLDIASWLAAKINSRSKEEDRQAQVVEWSEKVVDFRRMIEEVASSKNKVEN